jgi:hypothetical protein
LTSAQCADGFSDFEVVIGAHEVMNPSEEGHVETTSYEAYIHPEWDFLSLENDMAIIKSVVYLLIPALLSIAKRQTPAGM